MPLWLGLDSHRARVDPNTKRNPTREALATSRSKVIRVRAS